ncbi:hypothetical protein [Enterobacter ludwigii]
MFDIKTSSSTVNDEQEILANMLGSNDLSFEIQYHVPSANAQPLDEWFKNHYKKVALHAMNQAIHQKHVRIRSLSFTLQNAISRSVPRTGSAIKSRRSRKSAKNPSSSGSNDGSDPEPASVFGSLFPSCLCHLTFPFNSFANNSITEVAA